jgi:hypothetical protein
MDTLEARGVVAGFLLLATNVPISAVNHLKRATGLSVRIYYVIKYPYVNKVSRIY